MSEEFPYDVSSANAVIETSVCEMQGSTRTLDAHAAWVQGIVSLSRFQRSLEEQGISILGPSWPTRVCGPCIFQDFFSCDGKVTRSQSVPETPNVRLSKAWGHAVTRMEGGPNRALAPPARSHKRTYPGEGQISTHRSGHVKHSSMHKESHGHSQSQSAVPPRRK